MIPRNEPTNLILQLARVGNRDARRKMPIIDAPRADVDRSSQDFDWKPTIALVALFTVLILAVAYL